MKTKIITYRTVDNKEIVERTVSYESAEELDRAVAAFNRGDYGKLSSFEISYMKSLRDDMYDVKYKAAHAGLFKEDADIFEFCGFIFVYNLGRTLEEGLRILFDLVGPQPISALEIYHLEKKLNLLTRNTPNRPLTYDEIMTRNRGRALCDYFEYSKA